MMDGGLIDLDFFVSSNGIVGYKGRPILPVNVGGVLQNRPSIP
jgi:hypothetical protein